QETVAHRLLKPAGNAGGQLDVLFELRVDFLSQRLAGFVDGRSRYAHDRTSTHVKEGYERCFGEIRNFAEQINRQPVIKTNWFPRMTLDVPLEDHMRNILMSRYMCGNSNRGVNSKILRETAMRDAPPASSANAGRGEQIP